MPLHSEGLFFSRYTDNMTSERVDFQGVSNIVDIASSKMSKPVSHISIASKIPWKVCLVIHL